MSSQPLLTPPTAADFSIGWRDVTHTHADGITTITQVPLTLEDALHPEWGDVIVEGSRHALNAEYLGSVIRPRLAHDPTNLLLLDTKIVWDDPELRHHSPDIAVFFRVPGLSPDEEVSEYHVADYGVRPALIIELVSPSTRQNDVRTKLDHYYRARVPHYVIVDRDPADDTLSLRGYRRAARRYVPLQLDEDGRLWLEPLALFLGVRGTRAVLFDGETEEELGDYGAVSAQLVETLERARVAEESAETERHRAETERQRADAAIEQVARLAARLRELGIDLEQPPG